MSPWYSLRPALLQTCPLGKLTIFGFPWKPWTHPVSSLSFPALMYSSANPMGAIFIRHIEFKCFSPTSTPIILLQVTIISWLDCGPSLLFLLPHSTHLYFPNSNEKDAFQMKAHGDIWWFKSSHHTWNRESRVLLFPSALGLSIFTDLLKALTTLSFHSNLRTWHCPLLGLRGFFPGFIQISIVMLFLGKEILNLLILCYLPS